MQGISVAPGAQSHHVMYVGTFLYSPLFFFYSNLLCSLSETDGLIFYVRGMSEQVFFFLSVIAWIDNSFKDMFLTEEWERRNEIRAKLCGTGTRQCKRGASGIS